MSPPPQNLTNAGKAALVQEVSSITGFTNADTLRHTATHCNTLQHRISRTQARQPWCGKSLRSSLQNFTNADTLEHTATHCDTLQHTATYCNTLQHRISPTHARQRWRVKSLRSSPQNLTNADTLQHTPTHSNTLRHTATQNLTNAGKAALAREVSSIVSNIKLKSLETAASVSSTAPPSTSEARSSVASVLASGSPSNIPAASAPGGFCFSKVPSLPATHSWLPFDDFGSFWGWIVGFLRLDFRAFHFFFFGQERCYIGS